MIIFHEGLPRSGKSYEAMVKHVLGALKKGRKVFGYVEGIDAPEAREKIASLIDTTPEWVADHLIYIPPDQVPEIHQYVENDALVIIDELQDFFPAGRQKLSPGMTEFVTQHGHRGLDILAMGQDLRDCHNLWKRRVQRKITFTKLSAVGMENRYTWIMYEAITGEKFRKISSGQEKYDPKYFGIYKSHSAGTMNTGNLKDDRANIFKTPGFKYGVPAAIVAGIFAVNYLVGFFNGDGVVGSQAAAATVQETPRKADPVATVQPAPTSYRTAPAPAPQAKAPEPDPIDYLDRMASQYRFRLSGLVRGMDGRTFARIDVMDETYRLKEQFTLADVRSLGWTVEVHPYGLLIYKSDGDRKVSHVVRPWPVDPFGRVSQAQQQRL